MKTRLSIEVTTGKITRYHAGKVVPSPIDAIVFAGDKLDLEVVFTADGVDCTATTLGEGVAMRLGLRASGSAGQSLALCQSYTLAGGVASCILDLNTAAIHNFITSLPLGVKSGRALFEVEIEAGEGLRQTITQQVWQIQKEAIMAGDETPADAEKSQELASAAADRAEVAAGQAEQYKTDAANSSILAGQKADAALQSAINADGSEKGAQSHAAVASTQASIAISAADRAELVLDQTCASADHLAWLFAPLTDAAFMGATVAEAEAMTSGFAIMTAAQMSPVVTVGQVSAYPNQVPV